MIWSDLRIAWRTLRRSPTFTATAALTLALGIGGTTAMFSLVNAVLLKPLPYRDPGRLVRVWEANLAEGKDHFDVSPGTFVDWRARAHSFDDLALFNVDKEPTLLMTADGAVQAHSSGVTTNLFDLLGVRPALGRGFGAAATAPDEPSEIVIGH